MYIFAETALASCLACLSNKSAICQPLLARLWACSSTAKCQIYGQSQNKHNQGLWWEPPKADAKDKRSHKDPLPQTLYICRSVLQMTEGCSQTPQEMFQVTRTAKQRATIHVCISAFVSETPLDLFTLTLELTTTKNWIFFVGSGAVSSCVCVDQNWIFLKWPGDIFISVCEHPNPKSFKERVGHFQPCLWWQQHNYHPPLLSAAVLCSTLAFTTCPSPQAPEIWSVAWRTVKCQRESFTTGQFTFNTFNSERNPVPRLFTSPILINSGEITGSALQMWPRSGDSQIIRIRIIPFSQKWHISDDCVGPANPSLVLQYK